MSAITGKDELKPNPGSKEAQDQGCTCPVLDNNHGKGVGGLFWMNSDCPLHGTNH